MEHNFFTKIFLVLGVLISVFIFLSVIVGLPAILGDEGYKFLNSFVDFGIIKVQMKFIYILVAIISMIIAVLVGKGIDKLSLHILGEKTYENITGIIMIILTSIFGIIGALLYRTYYIPNHKRHCRCCYRCFYRFYCSWYILFGLRWLKKQ
jgi:hypothetical protein